MKIEINKSDKKIVSIVYDLTYPIKKISAKYVDNQTLGEADKEFLKNAIFKTKIVQNKDKVEEIKYN